jgi:glycoside/pentoside/hexuronide:cation symporter, GPH family
MSPPLSIRTKLTYALGALGEGIFSRGYEVFAFFYFVQVLGMSAWYGGLAMLISTLLDSVSDPLVGSISDRWKSQQGRRHPFMYASAVPLALTWYFLLSPPGGLDSFQLFLWFTLFSILLRMSLTLYHVPHLALGAELSTDYDERTSIVTWRILLGFLGSYGLTALFIRLFFPETPEYRNGLLNPAGYPQVALVGGLLMLVSIGYAAWGTRDRIPHLPSPPRDAEPLSPKQMVADLGVGLSNRSFRALFIGSFLFVISFSINEIFNQFLRIYFWEISAGQIAFLFVPGGIGFLAALPITRILHRRFDKKPTAIVTSLLPASLTGSLVVLQMLGALPVGKDAIVALLSISSFISAVCGAAAIISAQSMMADVAHEVAHTSRRDLTGMLFAGVSFSQKVSSGVGHFVATVALSLLAIPTGAAPGSLAPEQVMWLGISALVATAFALSAVISYVGYGIDRARHAELSTLPAEGRIEPTSTEPKSTLSGVASLPAKG